MVGEWCLGRTFFDKEGNCIWKTQVKQKKVQGAYLLYNLDLDTEEQNDVAALKEDIRDRLASQLESILTEMDAEMPVVNPNYKPESKENRFHLPFTKELAEKERTIFEERLKNSLTR